MEYLEYRQYFGSIYSASTHSISGYCTADTLYTPSTQVFRVRFRGYSGTCSTRTAHTPRTHSMRPWALLILTVLTASRSTLEVRSTASVKYLFLRPVFTFPSRLAQKRNINRTQNESRNLKNRPTCCRSVRARPRAARAREDRGRCVAVRVHSVWRLVRRSGTAVGSQAVGRRGADYNCQARLHRLCAVAAAAAAVEGAQRLDASRQGAVYHDELLAGEDDEKS